MIESILVATDGSETAVGAERYATALASRLRARLSGVTVVEDRDVRGPKDEGLSLPPFPSAELLAYHRARAEATARRFIERARSEGLEATCDTVQGSSDDWIVEKSTGLDLLVIGRDGKGASSRGGQVGSTAAAVVRRVAKATLVVPTGASLGGAIVLGFDGSPGSRIAARLSVELAGGLGESVHVFVDSKDKGRAVARFEEVRRLVSGLSVPVRETSSTLGRPDVKLIDTAVEARAGLVAIGAFGRNRITDYFLGSNAASVVRSSPVAVLLAR